MRISSTHVPAFSQPGSFAVTGASFHLITVILGFSWPGSAWAGPIPNVSITIASSKPVRLIGRSSSSHDGVYDETGPAIGSGWFSQGIIVFQMVTKPTR
jgi:hypothetical protein